MNKSFGTNLIALAVVLAGLLSPIHGDLILTTGLFSLSGGVTNWLAVHMLFEKVPFLYGSGVIPTRFEEFKGGIKQLIVQEFFTREHIERFFAANGDASAEAIMAKINFDRVFDDLTDAIAGSSMGPMLNMAGGKQALAPLKTPVTEKLQEVITELASGQGETGDEGDLTQTLIDQVEQIIDKRLAELTPDMVKTIVEDMIRRHLGWLVVWGGVFGGLIGLGVFLSSAI
ncbi:MAG: DUF445 domain-containing protein [Pseudomonadota bacterium]